MRSRFAVVVSALVTATCAAPATKPVAAAALGSPDRCLVQATDGTMIEGAATPPFYALVAHPDLYDGCLVAVAGYFEYDYPLSKLFVSADDRSASGMLFGAMSVRLHPSRRPLDLAALKAAGPRDLVLVEGRFKATKEGGNQIVEVGRYSVLKEPMRAKEH